MMKTKMMKKMMVWMAAVGLGVVFIAAPLQGQSRYGRSPHDDDNRYKSKRYEFQYGIHDDLDFRLNRREVMREIRRNQRQINYLTRKIRHTERHMEYRHVSRRQYYRSNQYLRDMRYEVNRLIARNRHLERMLLVRAYR